MAAPGFERYERLTPAAKMLLGLLWEMKGRNLGYLADERAAKVLGVSRRTVIRARLQLESEDLIKCHKQKMARMPLLYGLTALGSSSNVSMECHNESPKMSHNAFDPTPKGFDDLLLPEGLPRLTRSQPDRPRTYKPRTTLQGPTTRLDPETRNRTQAGWMREAKAAEAAEAMRPREAPEPAPWGRSVDQAPTVNRYHEARGKIRGEYAPDNGIGFTVNEQGRRKAEADARALRIQAEATGIKPLGETRPGRPGAQVTLFLFDPDTVPAGLRKSPLFVLMADQARQGRLL